MATIPLTPTDAHRMATMDLAGSPAESLLAPDPGAGVDAATTEAGVITAAVDFMAGADMVGAVTTAAGGVFPAAEDIVVTVMPVVHAVTAVAHEASAVDAPSVVAAHAASVAAADVPTVVVDTASVAADVATVVVDTPSAVAAMEVAGTVVAAMVVDAGN